MWTRRGRSASGGALRGDEQVSDLTEGVTKLAPALDTRAQTKAALPPLTARVSQIANLATQCVVCLRDDVAADQAGALVSRDSRAHAPLPWFALI
jgi:hypothetical protein